MTPLPTFTLVVPCYNYADYIGLTLDSARMQGRDDIEIIVVDDASTDHTADVVRQFPDVRYLRLDRNVGAARAWAIGMQQATGRYVAKLDADDWQLPGWFETVDAAFASDERIGLVAGSAVLWREQDVLVERVTRSEQLLDPAALRARLLDQFFFRMPAVCLRTEAVQTADPPRTDLRLPHDWEFFLRATRGWKGKLLPQLLGVYRVHAGSLTVTSKESDRLVADFRRFHDYVSDPDDPAYLDDDERARLARAMGRSYLGSIGPRLSFGDQTELRRHVRTAQQIAGWSGRPARGHLAGYVLYGGLRRMTNWLRRRQKEVDPASLLPPGYVDAWTQSELTG